MNLSSITPLHAILAAGYLATMTGATFAQDGGRVSINPMRGVEKAKLKAFVQQPLFNPARALPAAPAPIAYTPPVFALPLQAPPSIQLVGVIEGINAVAIVRNGASTSMLHAGERMGPWTVSILPGGLRLTNGDRVFDYTLFAKGGGAPVAGLPGVPPGNLVAPLGGPPRPDRPGMPP